MFFKLQGSEYVEKVELYRQKWQVTIDILFGYWASIVFYFL